MGPLERSTTHKLGGDCGSFGTHELGEGGVALWVHWNAVYYAQARRGLWVLWYTRARRGRCGTVGPLECMS